MKSQTGAKYLHKRNTRKDKTFNGLIKLTTKESHQPIIKLDLRATNQVK